ncbi:MAG: glycerophosphodiester phosphodiesterase family protein [Ornithinimicrobium sp.]
MTSSRRHGTRPLVIAHRGASGYRPEHTLAAYALAARMGADCIEPDLVATRDGVLVARHENEISGTTDVAQRPDLADLETSKEVDGRSVQGWFVEDLTLSEVRTLRAVERLPEVRPGNTATNGVWGIPTFAEILQLRESLSRELGRQIIVYPELKHPSHLRRQGHVTEEMLVEDLAAHHLVGPDIPVYIQCFESQSLRHLRQRCAVESPLLQLMPRGHAWSEAELTAWAADADGIGPDKASVIPLRADGAHDGPTTLVEVAHDVGLFVHPYTFRAENQFLPGDLRHGPEPAAHGDLRAEIQRHLAVGVDGFFTDHTDIGVAARNGADV